MPSRATSPPLTVTVVVAALWVSLGRCGLHEPPGPGCDNGKLSLDVDLPADAVYWYCSESTRPQSTKRRPSIDTVYDPEPARQICMDKPISYNSTIPNSGVYRPVRAESGEYLYCPPQRWLNNLHHGGIVLLYHPCAPLHERRLLSALARSCLSDYIITPHPQLSKHTPIALVSWGRTWELSTVASSGVCDGLATMATRGNKLRRGNHIGGYNLLLTWPAEQRRRKHASPEERSLVKMKESLRQCCERTISSALELEFSRKEGHLKGTEKEGKSRRRRAAIREKLVNHKNESNRENTTQTSTLVALPSGSPPGNRTISDPPGPGEAASQAKIQNLDPTAPLGTHTTIQAATTQIGLKFTDHKNTNLSADTDVPAEGVNNQHKDKATPEDLVHGVKDEGTTSLKHSAKDDNSKEKNYEKAITAHGKVKDNEVVDVKERELEHKQAHSVTHSHHKGEKSGLDSQAESPPQQEQQPPPPPQPHLAMYLPDSHQCDSCKPGEHCDCTKTSGAEAGAEAATVSKGLPRTPRTDEAVWAAAALGFLLVLLTLSVLHTRLYRHWRTTPSLYWHDPRQDYDSVADVIRRRLRIAQRRRKRGRRQECVLLPSSSSSDED